jgi:hypothetical protein
MKNKVVVALALACAFGFSTLSGFAQEKMAGEKMAGEKMAGEGKKHHGKKHHRKHRKHGAGHKKAEGTGEAKPAGGTGH